ncbi:MAG TPA: integrase core domain-containing protein [Ktedonobacteraceae bacterium]|nr:integrase core domain-containing protein [Ktedonobacteraceae bacterium]
MTTSYYADRLTLYQLMQRHPYWTQAELAQALGRSRSWVYKWQTRFADLSGEQEALLHQIAQGQSRARQHPPERIDERIETVILALRDEPPEGLRRTPGPKAILYYLPRQVTLAEQGLRLPTSTRTIYQILRRHDRIVRRARRPPPEDLPREAPMQCWQLDFKDVSTVGDDPQEPSGKRQHVAEALNIVDEGTSLLLLSEVRTDFTAETLLSTLAQALEQYGLPARITLDRDPRSVGAPAGSDFPSALLRFGRTLGIQMQVCAPHHPQQNGFVERYHRSYQEECLARERPGTVEQARSVTATWVEHYNRERPNQARSCANRPPRTAFPDLPSLPRPPQQVEADAWLSSMEGLHLERKVDAHGMVQLDLRRYYLDVHRAGQRVTLQVQAATRSLLIWQEETLLKTVPLRGLVGQRLSFERFVEQMTQQARAQHRLRSAQERRRRLA